MESYSLKIDIFPHIIPPKYKEAYSKVAPPGFLKRMEAIPVLYDLQHRLRIMEKYQGLVQVLTMASPPLEHILKPKQVVDLARMANDEMAELVTKYPDKFVAAIACLPMNDLDAALIELDRAIKDLKFRGVQIYTPINDKPMDSPEFMPFYEKMSQYNLPILIHPTRQVDFPDYRSEKESKYKIWHVFGWPYETTVAMTRLVFSGVLEKYPNLKFISHHSGAMVPFLEQRIVGCYDIAEMHWEQDFKRGLSKPPIEYFKMFYNDTAIYGSTPGLMCAYAFFGADHLLFGTDMPYDNQFGDRYIRQTINSIERMEISDLEKKMIFEDNARSLFRLPV